MGLFDRFKRRAEPTAPAGPPVAQRAPDAGQAETKEAAPATVIGVFARLSDAEAALTNLAEAGYEENSTSTVGRDAAQIANNAGKAGEASKAGPLAGVAPDAVPGLLVQRGLPADDAGAYRAALQSDGTVIAVAAPAGSEQSALEILTSLHAEHARVLGAAGDRP